MNEKYLIELFSNDEVYSAVKGLVDEKLKIEMESIGNSYSDVATKKFKLIELSGAVAVLNSLLFDLIGLKEKSSK